VQREGCRLPTGNNTELKDFFSGKFVFVMKKQFFGDFALCGWATDFRRFEGTYRLILQVYESMI
jgi:hypothetical protein